MPGTAAAIDADTVVSIIANVTKMQEKQATMMESVLEMLLRLNDNLGKLDKLDRLDKLNDTLGRLDSARDKLDSDTGGDRAAASVHMSGGGGVAASTGGGQGLPAAASAPSHVDGDGQPGSWTPFEAAGGQAAASASAPSQAAASAPAADGVGAGDDGSGADDGGAAADDGWPTDDSWREGSWTDWSTRRW